MSGQGYHFALTKREADALLALTDETEILDLTTPLVDSFPDGDCCGGEKIWVELHRCLSDGTCNPDGGSPPLNRPFLGGRLLVRSGSIVNFVSITQVREVAAVLAGLDHGWIRTRFAELFGAEYDGPVPEEELEPVVELFSELGDFYRRASVAGKAVMFVSDEDLDTLQS
jgi:Domain of unknown function (DUF1877)